MKKTYAILILALVLLIPALAHAWPAKVVEVTDGDTLVVVRLQDGEIMLGENGQPVKEKIRLFGIDCPETVYRGRWESQPYSRAATRFVRELFANSDEVDVAIWEMGESYGRIVGGVIKLHDGITLQDEIVKAGYGWVDPRYCKVRYPECVRWIALQKEAQAARRGLWRDVNPIAPWQWRRGAGDD